MNAFQFQFPTILECFPTPPSPNTTVPLQHLFDDAAPTGLVGRHETWWLAWFNLPVILNRDSPDHKIFPALQDPVLGLYWFY